MEGVDISPVLESGLLCLWEVDAHIARLLKRVKIAIVMAIVSLEYEIEVGRTKV